jgi:Rrf2 family transcriptional regulator, iron-sulfur cluster assembly transcription factor
MAFLSSTSMYALRAALHVADSRPASAQFVSTRSIAEDLHVPFAFLTKVLLGLTQSGILISQRGATGGVALAKPAASITLYDVVASIGEDHLFRDCVLGLPKCSDARPCALHYAWRAERSRLESLFRNTTLADLATKSPSTSSRAAAPKRGIVKRPPVKRRTT